VAFFLALDKEGRRDSNQRIAELIPGRANIEGSSAMVDVACTHSSLEQATSSVHNSIRRKWRRHTFKCGKLASRSPATTAAN
jgi:hypothetical protein